MSIETFNRYENKYRVNGAILPILRERLSERMTLDKYNAKGAAYKILNLYYDTTGDDVIRHSLAKPVYKEKLRLRAYGTPDANGFVYAEIKKKVRGAVNKRRSALTLTQSYQFLENGKLPTFQPYMNAQVLREIAYLLSLRSLKPALFLSYERIAYAGDDDLRVSFDTRIITRRCDLRLEHGVYGDSLLNENEWIMEIKTSANIPLWLANILSEYKLYSAGFSKYGAEYNKTLTQNHTDSVFVTEPQLSPKLRETRTMPKKHCVAVAAAIF